MASSNIDELQIQINYLQSETKGLDDVITKISKIGEAINNLKTDNLKELNSLLNKLSGASKKIENITPKVDAQGMAEPREVGGDIGQESLGEVPKITKDIDKLNTKLTGLKKLLGSIGRVAMYRMIRSAIKAITEAISTGLENAYHWSEAMGNGFSDAMDQIKSSTTYLQNAVGGVFANILQQAQPVITQLIDGFADVFNYISLVVARLNGATTYMKALKTDQKAYTNSVKEASKALAGFDELNNIGKSSSSSATDYSGMFEEANTNEEFEKLNELLQWIADNIDTIIISVGILWGILKFDEIIEKLALIKAFIGEHALAIAGVVLIISGLIWAISSVKDYMNDPTWQNFGEILGGISIVLLGISLLFTSLPVAIAGAVVGGIALISYFHDDIASFFDSVYQWFEDLKVNVTNLFDNIMTFFEQNMNSPLIIAVDMLIGEISGFINGIITVVQGVVQAVWQLVDGVVSGVKDIVHGVIQMFQGDFYGGLKRVFNGLISIVKAPFEALKTIARSVLNAVMGIVEGGINGAIRGINNFTSGARNAIGRVGSFFGQNWNIGEIGYVSLPRFDVGTNYVPQDMVAQIHEGEAIIPKKFNNAEFFNDMGGDSEETNSLLRELITVVRSKDYTISTDDIGKSAVKYINVKSRELGGSLI